MKPWVKRSVGALVVIGTGFVMATAWYVARAAPVCNGFTAKYLCSSTFIAGQDPRRAYSEDVAPVNPLAGLVRWRIDSRRMAATADILGFFRATALYRQGCGCTLLAGGFEAESISTHRRRCPNGGGRTIPAGASPWINC